MLYSILMIGLMKAIESKVLQFFNHKVLALLAIILAMPLIPLISVVFVGGVGAVVRILVIAPAVEEDYVGYVTIAEREL